MKITVVGAGKVGFSLCEVLANEGHDIVLIEQNEHLLDEILSELDINGLAGDALMLETLEEAGVEQTDIFIAVTKKDETNLLTSIIAKELGADYTIARVSSPKYYDYIDFMNGRVGIDLIINPELEATNEILRNFQFPSALEVESFLNQRVPLIALKIGPENQLIGIPLKELSKHFSQTEDILICIVERGTEAYIPDGDFVINEGDIIHITGEKELLYSFYKTFGWRTRKAQSSLIIGASHITFRLVPRLIKANIDTKVIEINQGTAYELAKQNPKATVIIGDGSDPEVLFQEHIESYDSFIALTGIDEENFVLSLFAQKTGVAKTFTKINRIKYLDVIGTTDLQTVVTPYQIITDKMIRVIRSLANSSQPYIENFYRLANNQIEAVEFIVPDNSKVIGIPIKDLTLRSNILLAFIMRDQEIIIPYGNDQLYPNDRVLIINKELQINRIDDILKR